MLFLSYLLTVLVLIGCCYLPSVTMFHDHSRPVNIGLILLHTAVGIIGLGVLGIYCKALGIDPRLSTIPCLFISAYGLRKFGFSCLPVTKMERPDSVGSWFTIVAVVIGLLYVVVPGIQMGLGAYPSVFFNVDTPLYLGQIHSLIQNAKWPPPSLDVLGLALGYHYGSQSACAQLSMLTGVAPHTMTFIVCMTIMQLAIISGIWLIVDHLSPKRNALKHGWAVPFLLFCSFYPIAALWPDTPPHSFYRGLRILTDPQAFRGGYPMLSSHFGLFIIVACILCLQNFVNAASRRMLTFLVGIMVSFKSPFFLVLGAGYGLWTLWEIKKTRRFSLMAGPLLSLLLALSLYTQSRPAETCTIMLSFGQFVDNLNALADKLSSLFAPALQSTGSHNLNVNALLDTLSVLLIYTLPGVLILLHLRSNARAGNAWQYLLCFCLPGLIFVNFFGMMCEGKFSGDLFQVTSVFPVFAGMFTLTLAMNNWRGLDPLWQRSLVTLIVLVILPPLMHRALQTCVVLVRPQQAHEYVNNKSLAQALSHIPVRGTLLVTNDFHYPSQNNKRDLQQMQFSSVFGHQMYAVRLFREQYNISRERLDEQLRFRLDPWDASLEQLANRKGWTHLVVHIASPHASVIPLPLLFENVDYQVYQFQHTSK